MCSAGEKQLTNWLCGAVVSARDEEHVIETCLQSLRNQTIRVFLVVVNDGSIDKTAEIASHYADSVVTLPRHEENWTGKPELAEVFNAGFRVLREKGIPYILISGADCEYPPNYVEELVDRMKNGKYVLSSGVVEGETSHSLSPRGGGRIMSAEWFESVGFRYPENFGFEVYPVYKALSQGLRVTAFLNLKFRVSRGTQVSRRKLYLWGKGMKALNYWWLYAVGRAFLEGAANPLNTLAMLKGYVSSVPIYEDLKVFVPKFQERLAVRRLRQILRF
jgi:glycosyltransferase involved in cell wall biosynthesis